MRCCADIAQDSDGPVQLELPEQWLWDIIDEFIYQYQVFCTWRSKVTTKTQDELMMLAEGGPVSALISKIRKHFIEQQ